MQITVKRARTIQKSLGLRVAAGYLRNSGISIELALYILLGV